MTTRYRPYAPDQVLWLPPSLNEWLPEGHLAYFVSDTVEALDLSAFHARYAGDGRRRQPFDPAMMVKVLVYAYASGILSSRKIARGLEQDVALRVLGAGNFPAHRTIREFRQLHLKEFCALFVQVVQLAREAGLIKLGRVGIDGTKVKANASKHKAMSYGRMREKEQELKAEIDGLLRKAEGEDGAEDRQYGIESRGDELPKELARRQQRLQAIQAAKARLQARQRQQDEQAGRREDDAGTTRGPSGRPCRRALGEVPDKAQDNFTDPESRIMKTTYGFDQCYNAQTAVDEGSQLIVATEVSNSATDNHRLLPMVEAVRSNLGVLPDMTLADAGYASEANFEALEALNAPACIALSREGKRQRCRDPEHHPATQRMAERLATAQGKDHYRRRKCIPEPVFGWIKEAMGFRCFRLRGLAQVSGEWDLACLALNLRRMHRLGWVPG